MKTERKQLKLSGVTFVFIFFHKSENKYRNFKNKYRNRYGLEQMLAKYGVDTERKVNAYRNPKKNRLNHEGKISSNTTTGKASI
jgi:hypothetical protein